jgi:flagellar motor switch protein FliM
VLAYPVAALHDIAEGGAPGQYEESSRCSREMLERMIPGVPVGFSASLQPSRVAFGDLADLRAGDVLRLDHELDDLAVGMVGDVPVLEGRIGRGRSGRLAMEVTGWLDERRLEQSE